MIDRSRAFCIFLILTMAMLLAACGDDDGMALDPPDIAYGEDVSEMGMFVTDPRYTVATLPEEDDEWPLFDDIGELFKYRGEHPDAAFDVMWVNDYHDEEWIRVEDAWYVESPALTTPMGWGVAALRSETTASELQAEIGGDLMSWAEVEDREWSAPPAPMAHDSGPSSADRPAATPEHRGH